MPNKCDILIADMIFGKICEDSPGMSAHNVVDGLFATTFAMARWKTTNLPV